MTDTVTGDDTAVSAPPTGDTEGPMIPKHRLDQEIGKRKALEDEVSQLVDTIIAEVPERFRDLIPAGLTPAEKVNWIALAKAKGLFADAPVPETDQEKPKTTPRDRNVNDLPVHARIAAGYK